MGEIKNKPKTTKPQNKTRKALKLSKPKPATEMGIQPTSKYITAVYEKYCTQRIFSVSQVTKLYSA